MKEHRKEMQMIFQDPYASLDPRMTVEEIISEPLVIYGIGNKKERRERVIELLEMVGLSAEHSLRFPTNFPADRDSGSASPVPWPCAPNSSSAMSPSPPWTFPFRRKS